MKVLVLITLLPVAFAVSQEWKFGIDDPYSEQTTNVVGEISFFTHTVLVPLTVPQCHNTTFVKVRVDNTLATPNVTLDKDYNTVVIQYRFYQSSSSQYQVLAKSRKVDYPCFTRRDGSD